LDEAEPHEIVTPIEFGPKTEEPPKEEPKPAETPPAQAPPEGQPPAAPPDDGQTQTPPKTEEPPKARVEKKPPLEDRIAQQVDEAMAKARMESEEPPPAKQAAKPEATKEEAPDYTGWTETDIEDYETLRFAEETQPERFKGAGKKFLDFRRKLENYRDEAAKSGENRTFDAEDYEFVEWVRKNRPEQIHLAPQQKTRLQMDRVSREAARQAVEEIEKKHADETSKLRQQLQQLELKPKITSEVTRFQQNLDQALGEEEELKPIMEQRRQLGAKFPEKFPAHSQVMESEFQTGLDEANTFMQLEYGLIAPDNSNPRHGEIAAFIHEQGNRFAQDGGERRFKEMPTESGGTVRQQFLPRAQYAQVARDRPQEIQKYWTFSDQDIMGMLCLKAKFRAAARLKELDQAIRTTAATYQQMNKPPEGVPLQQPAPAREILKPVPSPTVTGAQAPGAAQPGAEAPKKPTALGEGFSALGLDQYAQ
jgi:hypothetical protein